MLHFGILIFGQLCAARISAQMFTLGFLVLISWRAELWAEWFGSKLFAQNLHRMFFSTFWRFQSWCSGVASNWAKHGRAPKYRKKGCPRYWSPKFAARKWLKRCKKSVFALPGCQQMSLSTLLCDTLPKFGAGWKHLQRNQRQRVLHYRGVSQLQCCYTVVCPATGGHLLVSYEWEAGESQFFVNPFKGRGTELMKTEQMNDDHTLLFTFLWPLSKFSWHSHGTLWVIQNQRFFFLFRPFLEGPKSTWNSRKRRKWPIFQISISSDLLKPHLFIPHLRHSK